MQRKASFVRSERTEEQVRKGSSPAIFPRMDDIVQVNLNLYTKMRDCVERDGMFGGSFLVLSLVLSLWGIQIQIGLCKVAK